MVTAFAIFAMFKKIFWVKWDKWNVWWAPSAASHHRISISPPSNCFNIQKCQNFRNSKTQLKVSNNSQLQRFSPLMSCLSLIWKQKSCLLFIIRGDLLCLGSQWASHLLPIKLWGTFQHRFNILANFSYQIFYFVFLQTICDIFSYFEEKWEVGG